MTAWVLVKLYVAEQKMGSVTELPGFCRCSPACTARVEEPQWGGGGDGISDIDASFALGESSSPHLACAYRTAPFRTKESFVLKRFSKTQAGRRGAQQAMAL